MAEERDRELGSQALAGALQSSFRLLQLAMLAMLVYILFTGVYIVKQDEVALVLRLGKVVGSKADRIRHPGLHFGFPYPIDEVIRVPVQRVLTISSDTHWYKLTDEEKALVAAGKNPGPGPRFLRPLIDGYMLTGDANILHSKWELRYRIVDPVRYALDFSPETIKKLLRDALDNAVLIVCARYQTDAAQRTEVNAFREDVQEELAKILVEENLGCSVERVDSEIVPPRQVKAAFDAVIAAEQEGSRLQEEAKAYAFRVENEALANASRIVAEAEARSVREVQQTEADAKAFNKLLPRYRRSPDVVRKTLWLDTLTRVLDNVDEKLICRDGDELRIQLGRDPKVLAERSRQAAEQRVKGTNKSGESSSPAAGPGS